MNRLRRKIIGMLILVCTVVVGIGIGSFILSSDDKVVSMIFIPKVIDEKNDFLTALIACVKMAVQEYKVEMTIISPKTE